MKKALPYIIIPLAFIAFNVIFIVCPLVWLNLSSVIGTVDFKMWEIVLSILLGVGILIDIGLYTYIDRGVDELNPKFFLGFIIVDIIDAIVLACLAILAIIPLIGDTISIFMIVILALEVILTGMYVYKYLFTTREQRNK